jgi:O-antigen ligase
MTMQSTRRSLGLCADWLAVAMAAALPWSTTLTVVFIAIWLLALLGSWNLAERLHEPFELAGGLPIALWALAAVGMLWADAPWAERIEGLHSFHKLWAIPLLAIQFRDSDRGVWVLIGFLASCTIMLLVSWGLVLLPGLAWRGRQPWMIGVPVKNPNSQAAMFTLCAFGLAEVAIQAWRKARRHLAWLLVSLAVLFLVNILCVAVSRTALVALPILLVLFAFRRLGWKGAAGLLLATTAIVLATWVTCSHLRERTTVLFEDIREPNDLVPTSGAERLEFWRKSVAIITAAPVFGHGTGTIPEQFRRSAVGQTGIAAQASTNPHNQIFATAIQLGLVGTLLLFAMWTAHLRFLGGPGVAAGIGLVVVIQNIVSSLFNSSLFDFVHGWIYVLGVGTLCGMVLRDGRSAPRHRDERRRDPLPPKSMSE